MQSKNKANWKPLKRGTATITTSGIATRISSNKKPTGTSKAPLKSSRAKKPSVAQLKKTADKVFSEYVRRRDARFGCITCGNMFEWKGLQNGHFVSRKVSMLRYDPINCNAQCMACNVFKHGDLYNYAIKLDERYGAGTAQRLHDQRFSTHSFKRQELEDIIIKYNLT